MSGTDPVAEEVERRQQRRNIALTITVCAMFTAGLAALAVARVHHASAATRIAVSANHAGSTPPPTHPVSTTTLVPMPSTTVRTTTTTTTLPAIVAPTTTVRSTTTTVPRTTTTTTAPAPIITWSVTPSVAAVPSGGSVVVVVEVTNTGNADGSVTTPGCPSAPRSFARTAAPAATTTTTAPRATGTTSTTAPKTGLVCAQSNQVVPLLVNHYIKWNITVSATKDATPSGVPLAVGRYHVQLSGATLELVVG